MNFLNLQMLLAPWKINAPVVSINGMTLDSRCVLPGDLFIAIHGFQNDGRCYIYDAINKGVSAVLSETNTKSENGCVHYINNIPVIFLYNLKDYLSLLAGRFYGHPSFLLKLVGVTGTNGKTTVSHLLFQWVHLLSERSAVMGTVGNGLFNNLSPSANTTLSAVEIQKMLAYFYQQGVTFVASEVSSHALVQNRVRNLYFHAAIFTNLTHDHLDYHGSMLSYEAAKWKLFSQLKVTEYIINADDCFGFQWLSKLSHGTLVTFYRRLLQYWHDKWLYVISVRHCDDFSVDIMFNSTWGKGLIHSKLIGRYNISNLLLALATLLSLDYPLFDLLEKAPQLSFISGRMETFRVFGYPTVVVDYAHTPDALKRVLLEIRSYCSSKIWCIFGCGGDRDQKKRPIMGKIAGQYADRVIITDDNPRTEKSQNIINDIQSGLIGILPLKYVQVIPHREEALHTVISQAKVLDWILIAGKGHENYQVIGYNKIAYSDQSVIKKVLDIDR